MIGRLNHVGIATPSIEQSWKLYLDVLGATKVTEKKALPEQGVWVSFVELPNAQIELIEPKVVATLGNFATKLLSGKPTGITRVHGQEQEVSLGGRPVEGAFGPEEGRFGEMPAGI